MIKLNHVSKKYDSNIIFENLSYEFKDNSFMGIGSNGDDWYTRKIQTTIQFRDSSYKIINYAPQNKPSTTSGTIGVGLWPS